MWHSHGERGPGLTVCAIDLARPTKLFFMAGWFSCRGRQALASLGSRDCRRRGGNFEQSSSGIVVMCVRCGNTRRWRRAGGPRQVLVLLSQLCNLLPEAQTPIQYSSRRPCTCADPLMLSVSESAPSLARNARERRSFPNSLRSPFDMASNRLSFSGRHAARSGSISRSTSSMSDRADVNEVEDAAVLPGTLDDYTLHSGTDLRRSSVIDLSAMIPQASQSSSSLHRLDTDEYDKTTIAGARPSSGLSVREGTLSSGNLSGSNKWYKRFSRSGSGNRLAKALDTSEAALNSSSSKSYNPFARRRSVPAISHSRHTILGQTAKRAIEIGGHASQASKLLPRDLLPTRPIEVPYIVDACIAWLIENHAHMSPGIFRINGSNQAVKSIVDHFSSGSVRMPLENITLPALQMISVHDVASCLKKFLVLLPGGLFGETVFESLLAISAEDTSMCSQETLAKDTAGALQMIKDMPKFDVLVILMAFLRQIADESRVMAKDDDPKQEAGYMTSFSLGIVFSPTCLGSHEGPVEMRRSSTSYSDRSIQSDSTPIEEAVALARQGARVFQMLIDRWPQIVQHLSTSGNVPREDSVSLLDVVTLPDGLDHKVASQDDFRDNRPLHTILDSPIKDMGNHGSYRHSRTESIDTVTMSKHTCECESSLLVKDAKIELLLAKIRSLEQENADALANLRSKSEEAAALFTRTLELEREIARQKRPADDSVLEDDPHTATQIGKLKSVDARHGEE